MKTFTLAAIAALAISTAPAFAADMPVKAKPVAAPPPPAWDIAFGARDRQRLHLPRRLAVRPQAVGRVPISSRATTSTRIPALRRHWRRQHRVPEPRRGRDRLLRRLPTDLRQARVRFRRLVLLVSGRAVLQRPPAATAPSKLSPTLACSMALPNGNVAKNDLSFFEFYGKVTYTVTDAFALGAYVYYSPTCSTPAPRRVLRRHRQVHVPGARRTACSPTSPAKSATGTSAPATRSTAYHAIGASKSGGIPLHDYTTWNVGFGWTWKVFTRRPALHRHRPEQGELQRFHQRPHRAFTAAGITPINAGGSARTGAARRFVARLSADLTVNTNLK